MICTVTNNTDSQSLSHQSRDYSIECTVSERRGKRFAVYM